MRCAGAFHDSLDELSRGAYLGSRRLEQELVMDLQQHASPQVLAGQGGRDTGHRALDDVGGRAL